MELSFMGNTYTQSNERPIVKPYIQLKYMGNTYQARIAEIKKSHNSLTYRGVEYSR